MANMMKSRIAGGAPNSGTSSKTTSPATAQPRSRQLLPMPALPLLPAEQAARLEDQDERHDEEHHAIDEQRKAAATEGAREADQQRGHESAGDRPHAANHRDDEGFDQDR